MSEFSPKSWLWSRRKPRNKDGMNLDLYNQKFSAAQVAKMLNKSVQNVNKRAKTRNWKHAAARMQGGGYLWLFKDWDQETKEEISLDSRLSSMPGPPANPSSCRRL
jgi:hypothetical protein